MKIKIAVADDHPLMIIGLNYVISNSTDMEITGSYSGGSELLNGLAKALPDVLLLDIHMPGQKGDELAEIISARHPTVKILVITNEDDVFHIKNMMQKGVNGYILKTARGEILLDAIRKVFAGRQFLESNLKDKLVQDMLDTKKHNTATLLLSRREKEVLHLIASNLTSQQIADQLNVSKRTVDYHRLNLLTKLDVKNVAALVKKGLQLGLID